MFDFDIFPDFPLTTSQTIKTYLVTEAIYGMDIEMNVTKK